MLSLDLTGLVLPGDPELSGGLMTESGLRTRDAAELRDILAPHMPDYGMTRIAHLTGFDFLGLPVHMAMKPQGLSLSSGSGKGTTKAASWVSAFMECAEQAIWETLDLETVTANERSLQRMGVAFVPGDELPMALGGIWSDTAQTNWVPGWDVIAGEEVYVPSSLVDISPPVFSASRPFVSGSNGLASGAHVLEAMLSGLQEVVERDGMTLNTIATRRARQDPMAKLAAVSPWIHERIVRAGLRLEVIDASADDVGVPVIVAYLHDVEGGRTGTFKGAGAGTSTNTAFVRAVTEAAQARCLIVAGARDDQFESQRTAAQWAPSLGPADTRTEFAGDVEHGTGSVLGDLTWMSNRVVEAGFRRVIVLRHTQPDEPVQVVRVIVPGLEGYPFSYAQFGKRARQAMTKEAS